MTSDAAESGARIRTFFVLWIGQLVSVIGSGLTTFALGVWVYRATGSATQYALIALFGTLPSIVLGPVAGALVDRWNRRTAMLVADLVAGAVSIALVVCARTDHLSLAVIFVAVSISAISVALRYPAYTAVVTVLVPRAQLGRAAGLVQASDAAAQLICPLAAGALVVRLGISPILLIDLASFVVALGTLLASRVPVIAAPARTPFVADLAFGMGYLRAHRGLLALLVFFAIVNLLDGIVVVLAPPMILSFADAEGLGFVLTIGGVGMLSGALMMSAWGGPQRRIPMILWSEVACGVIWIGAGVPQSVALIAAAAFGLFFLNSIVNSLNNVVWLTKVAPEIQGRVLTVRRMVVLSTQPLAFLVAGPLADGFANPLLAPGGALASSVGRIVGVGPGRGIGFLFILAGVGTIVAGLAARLHRGIRQLDEPDHEAQERSA